MNEKFCALIILDGFGENQRTEGNAIKLQGTPYIDSLKQKYPYTTLGASGEDVGIIEGQMGDSEVGHMNIGAGRVVTQNLLRINNAIKDKSFFTNPSIVEMFKYLQSSNKDLHLIGLLSDGGVHSHYKHLFAYMQMAKEYGIKNVYIHPITDGRDTGVRTGVGYIKLLTEEIERQGIGKVASLSGRLYAMDREQNYDRTWLYYDAIVNGNGIYKNSVQEAIQDSYDNDITDEFVKPYVILDNGKAHTIQDGDGIIVFNYRKDRPRQILNAFLKSDFDKFETKKFDNLKILTTTSFDKTFDCLVAFEDNTLDECLSEIVSRQGYRQVKVAETTKYAHVTYYLNGTVEPPFDGEDRKLFDSDKVKNFAEKPLMQAGKIADYVCDMAKSGEYKLIVANIANGDMIGHTGDMQAAKITVEEIDNRVKQIVTCLNSLGGTVIVTADHGNVDEMINDKGEVSTNHSLNRVPFILVNDSLIGTTLKENGKLCDIAPTILKLLGITKPAKMTGEELF